MVQAVNVIGEPPTFVIVTVDFTWVPTFTVPKLTVVGVNSTPVPVPANARVCGLDESVSAMLSVPVA
jgi:hypothetical protein